MIDATTSTEHSLSLHRSPGRSFFTLNMSQNSTKQQQHWVQHSPSSQPYAYPHQSRPESSSSTPRRSDSYTQHPQPPPYVARTSSAGSIDSGRSISDNTLEREESNQSGRYSYATYPGPAPLDQAHPPTPQRESLKRPSEERHHMRQPSRESFGASEAEESASAANILPSIKELCCSHCNQVFLDAEQLKTHAKTHVVEDRPYHCPICQHTFSRLHDLERHTMIHTGERPHVCDECGRRFARAYTMARHKTGGGGCAGKRQAQRGPKGSTPSPSSATQSPPQDHPPPPSVGWFDKGPSSPPTPRYEGPSTVSSG